MDMREAAALSCEAEEVNAARCTRVEGAAVVSKRAVGRAFADAMLARFRIVIVVVAMIACVLAIEAVWLVSLSERSAGREEAPISFGAAAENQSCAAPPASSTGDFDGDDDSMEPTL